MDLSEKIIQNPDFWIPIVRLDNNLRNQPSKNIQLRLKIQIRAPGEHKTIYELPNSERTVPELGSDDLIISTGVVLVHICG